MTPDLFGQILEKIKREMPEKRVVNLYIFGDPMLSPYLFDIIDLIHENNMFAAVSTNLSMEIDFKMLMEHSPDCLKVSLSGFTQEIYSTTHNGGNIWLVKSNLYKMRYMMDRYRNTMRVIVGYHLYKNNGGEEERQMALLCKELSFLFQVKTGIYWNIRKKIGIDQYNDSDLQFIDKYCIVNESLQGVTDRESENHGPLTCGYLEETNKSLFIDHDGKVMLCCNFRSDDAIFDYTYLDTPISVIQEDRCKHFLCKACIKNGLNY